MAELDRRRLTLLFVAGPDQMSFLGVYQRKVHGVWDVTGLEFDRSSHVDEGSALQEEV
jgi:hypothetical protein